MKTLLPVLGYLGAYVLIGFLVFGFFSAIGGPVVGGIALAILLLR